MSDIDVLESVLAKDVALVSNVRPDQLDGRTPCPDYDVRTLLNHVIGWMQMFAATANDRPFSGDPTSFATDDHAGEFKAAADDLLQGWRSGGTDRTLKFASSTLPGESVLGMTLMEYVGHGCDIALGTGQEVPFSDEELETTLARAKANLPDDYRGEGKPFADAVAVADDAPALDRLLGFLGRRSSFAGA